MFLWTTLVACTNSGLGQTDLDSGHSGAVTGLADCPWVGTWNMVTIACAGFANDEWAGDYGKASMEITQDPAGGCAVEAQIVDQGCTQKEKWHFSAPLGSAVDITLDGVSACQPAQCVFPAGDECEKGTGDRNINAGYISDATGDLEAKDLLADTFTTCSLEVVTTWRLKP